MKTKNAINQPFKTPLTDILEKQFKEIGNVDRGSFTINKEYLILRKEKTSIEITFDTDKITGIYVREDVIQVVDKKILWMIEK